MITTDAEYSTAIKALLDDLNMRLTNPAWMPISAESQAQFIHAILGRTHEIVNSEPFLRGKLVDTVDKMREFDVGVIGKDRDRYREVANILYNVLLGCPFARMGKEFQNARKQALEAAERVL